MQAAGERDRRTPVVERVQALAARLLQAPWAHLTLFRAAPEPGEDARTLSRVVAAEAKPVLVADAPADARLADVPGVRSGRIASYLGLPLVREDGSTAGVLGVAETEPRTWTVADVALLEQLAASALAELELSALALQVEADRLRWALAIDAAGVGGYDWDLRTGELTWDARLIELFGYDEASFDHSIASFEARVHPDDRARVSAELGAAIEACASFELEYRIVRPDALVRWVQARGRVLADADGAPARVLGVAYDSTDAKDAQARVVRVLEAMHEGFAALDRDWRVTYANPQALAILGMRLEDALGRDLWTLFPALLGTPAERAYREAMSSGEVRTFETYYPAPLDAWFEIRAWPGPDGLSVYFEDVTERRAARVAAEAATRRLALLSDVSAELAATLDAEVAVARLAQMVVPALADWCIVTLVGDDDQALRDVGWWHADDEARPLVERYAQLRLQALSDASYVARALRTGQPALVEPPASEAIAQYLGRGEARDLLLRLAPVGAAVLPLRGRDRTVGLLTVFTDAQRGPLGAEDLATAREVAARAGLALDNARLYAQQRRLAEELQRSLLSAPPEPDHLQLVVRYEPAAEAAQVGGDWYDAFLQSDGSTVLVIGDVVGHDTAAAAAMGQLRSLLRGIAFTTEEGPARVLQRLDRAVEGLQVGTTATAVVARLEQDEDLRSRRRARLRWSNAGHPPPVVVHPDGRIEVLGGEEADLLLGLWAAVDRAETTAELEWGTTVLLYTDGLVERRGQSLDEGTAALCEVLAEVCGGTLDELCDGVLERLRPEVPEDDVALVAVRLHRQDRPRPAEAGPNRVPPEVPPAP
ncbi:PAS domain S-box-containing protein [Kineococcus xinjiangensis]|uniref:PAS domain S-box-containing protein n=1 Tax=Kineococcus xinjiangensis TaxID=512762 RepID=A0A2S6IU22_9ACTN|nr:SpoIIE family protein phosphatase [Kineococcus xinjiangensis]PPK97749.1 PAS domain S-box-containing protein [Kineococcus xinjiangensis]